MTVHTSENKKEKLLAKSYFST